MADDDGDVSQRDKESLKENNRKSDTAWALLKKWVGMAVIQAVLIYFGYQVKIRNLLNMDLFLNKPEITQLFVISLIELTSFWRKMAGINFK